MTTSVSERWMRAVLVAMTLLAVGCGGAAPVAQHLRYADATQQGIDWTRPVVLEFQPGDRLPVRLTFDDQLFDLSPSAPPLELVVKRHGFVRVEAGRITSSLTGSDFGSKPLEPGKFRFGLAATREGTRLELVVATPRHAEPGAGK